MLSMTAVGIATHKHWGISYSKELSWFLQVACNKSDQSHQWTELIGHIVTLSICITHTLLFLSVFIQLGIHERLILSLWPCIYKSRGRQSDEIACEWNIVSSLLQPYNHLLLKSEQEGGSLFMPQRNILSLKSGEEMRLICFLSWDGRERYDSCDSAYMM